MKVSQVIYKIQSFAIRDIVTLDILNDIQENGFLIYLWFFSNDDNDCNNNDGGHEVHRLF